MWHVTEKNIVYGNPTKWLGLPPEHRWVKHQLYLTVDRGTPENSVSNYLETNSSSHFICCTPTIPIWWKYRRMVDEEAHNAEQQPSQSCFIFTLLSARCSNVVSVVGYTTREPDGGNALSSAAQHEHPSESSWAEPYYWAMIANFSCLPPCVNLMFPHHRRCSKVLEDVSLAVMMWDLECRS